VANVLAFLGVALLVIVTPGQDTALTIRNTLAAGRRAGVHTAAGVSTAQAIWAVSAAVGVTALLRASEPAFLALRLAGSAYLVYLGVQALRSALGRRPAVTAGPARRRVPAFRQGVISNLGNPKMAVFFTSLLPQFGSSFPALLALGLVFCALTLAWLSAYAAAVAKAGDVLRRSRVRRWLDGLTGAVLVAFGLRLATER
jgi:threonine/homoserine/homoserine lactone efflux protein